MKVPFLSCLLLSPHYIPTFFCCISLSSFGLIHSNPIYSQRHCEQFLSRSVFTPTVNTTKHWRSVFLGGVYAYSKYKVCWCPQWNQVCLGMATKCGCAPSLLQSVSNVWWVLKCAKSVWKCAQSVYGQSCEQICSLHKEFLCIENLHKKLEAAAIQVELKLKLNEL